MRILIVCSGNRNVISSFIIDQVTSLENLNYEVSFFAIHGRNFIGYISNLPRLYRVISKTKFDLIHAHYGLSGMLAVLQRLIPVVITFHGSDLQLNWRNVLISRIASRLSDFSIFVNESLIEITKPKVKYDLIPCGVDLNSIFPLDAMACRRKMNLDPVKLYILFSGAFDNKVKNYQLAKSAIEQLPHDVEIIELKGYSRESVNFLMNACNCLLVTSHRETGPLVVKEAMACNIPIVSTDVGDVKAVTSDTSGCFLTSFDPNDVADKVIHALEFSSKHSRTNGRERIKDLGLNIESIANRISDVYKSLILKTPTHP